MFTHHLRYLPIYILKQPYYKNLVYRVANDLRNTEIIMNKAFWMGVYPGLSKDMLDYMVTCIKAYYIDNN